MDRTSTSDCLAVTMNVGETSQASTIIESRSSPHTTDLPHYPRHAQTSSASSFTSSSASRSRPSSAVPQAPPRNQPPPHIRFRGASTPQNPQNAAGSHSAETMPQSQSHDQRRPDLPPPSPRLQPTYSTISLNGSLANSPSRIKVRDLSHIQSFASEEVLTRSHHTSRHSLRGRLDGGQQYEISAMPVTDIIEMVAGLLTKITTTNDKQHENIRRQAPSDDSPPLSQRESSVLAFHGKNVPTITIASYLMRIHKYCPTTYEVFLSLLVYFDRMTEMSKSDSHPQASKDEQSPPSNSRTTSTDSHDSSNTVKQDAEMTTPPPSGISDSDDFPSQSSSPSKDAYATFPHFIVDSYNIHRLVMAAVTCASKFFSDVFYTNSRYAKVDICPPIQDPQSKD